MGNALGYVADIILSDTFHEKLRRDVKIALRFIFFQLSI